MSSDQGGASRQLPRLPQDVGPPSGGDRRGVPALEPLAETPPREWLQRHRAALDAGDHEARTMACWGLVAHGRDADAVVSEMLGSDVEDVVEDAAGVLTWTGVPDSLAARVEDLAGRTGDTQAGDALWQALEASGL